MRLIEEQFGERQELEVTMDNANRSLLVQHDEPRVYINFDDGEDRERMDFQAAINLSVDEARNLMHCLERVLDWDPDFEKECADYDSRVGTVDNAA